MDDGRGGSATQDFTVTVSGQPTAVPPAITSSPPLFGVVGRSYAYNATASNPGGGTLVWTLVAAPAGMSVDVALGTVRWTPTADELGPQNVSLRVAGSGGGEATQPFTVTVLATDVPPVISSSPRPPRVPDRSMPIRCGPLTPLASP